ncbi:MAG: PAS domain S-box protein [Magnetococcales bacterium]|nr:PAS domain S-box protein [Magnetococcales bacterium]
MDLFTLITPLTYLLLIILWCAILVLISRQYRSLDSIQGPTRVLIAVLAIDALRTLFESIYFGSWYSARVGYLPEWLFELLVQPQNVFIPKIINVLTAAVIVVMLLRQWLPALNRAEQEHDRQLEALKESEGRFRSYFDLGLIGMAITSLEKGWVQYNDRLCEILGQTRASMQKVSWSDITHPDDVEKDLTQFNRVLAGEIDGYTLDKRFLKPDGTLVYASISAKAILNPDGTIDHFVALVQDITERKRAEETRERLLTIIESAEDFIAIAAMDGTLLFINQAGRRMIGLEDAQQVPTLEIADIHPAKTFHTLQEEGIPTAIRDGSWKGETQLLHRSGKRIAISQIVVSHNIETGQSQFLSTIARDITDHKQTERQLRRTRNAAQVANRTKSAFLATMSHEIRTPLNAILGMAELLSETPLTDSQQWCVSTLNRSGEALLTLINDILDLSKIESGQMTLESTSFDLKQSVEDTVDLFAFAALEQKIAFSHHVAPDLPRHVQGDPSRLRQILLNLISNAIKFTQQGSVAVEVGNGEGDTRILTVRDTGPGISEEMQQEIFQPFTQADSSITRKHGGSGLGLSICQRLAHLMGGEITLESTPGSGSVFRLIVPLAAVDHTAKPPPDGAFKKGGSDGDKARKSPSEETTSRILLVDDSEDNRLLINAFLKKEPHTLVMAENGEQAVALFQSQSFQLVLMDIQMPVMDGYEATRRMRRWEEQHALERTPIIALTAHALVEESEQITAAGCDLHVAKPIRKQRLLEIVSAYTDSGSTA